MKTQNWQKLILVTFLLFWVYCRLCKTLPQYLEMNDFLLYCVLSLHHNCKTWTTRAVFELTNFILIAQSSIQFSGFSTLCRFRKENTNLLKPLHQLMEPFAICTIPWPEKYVDPKDRGSWLCCDSCTALKVHPLSAPYAMLHRSQILQFILPIIIRKIPNASRISNISLFKSTKFGCEWRWCGFDVYKKRQHFSQ